MRKALGATLFVIVLGLLVAGCGGPPAQPLSFRPAEPPYALAKHQNRASGAVFQLRSISTGPIPAAASTVAPVPPATPTAGQAGATTPSAMPPVNIALLATILGIQLPVMLGLPILLGWYIRRRWDVGWGVFAMGMLAFVLSQLVHIPLNAALGLLGAPPRGVALWPVFPLGLAVGLSAAICEEGARLLVITLLARRIRGWRAGLQFGAGHGGVESIILGLLTAINVGAILASRSIGAAAQLLPQEALVQLRAAQEAFWAQSALLPLVGALERLFALSLHITLGVLVVTAVTRRRPLYFLLALALHTVADAWIIWARNLGVAAIEAGIGLVALTCLWVLWRLREQPGERSLVLSSEPSGGSAPMAADLTEQQLSPEELARRADRSRYE